MKSRVLFAIFVAIVAMGSSRSWAQSPEALKKAQAAFDQAQTDYLAGKYDDAASGFQAAYSARPQTLSGPSVRFTALPTSGLRTSSSRLCANGASILMLASVMPRPRSVLRAPP